MHRWGMGMLCLAALIAYVQRSALSVPTKNIQADLGIDASAMGWVMATWYWGYAILQVPAGWIADSIGSRKALAIYAFAWSILTGVAGFSGSFGSLIFLWGLMGMAQAGIFPASAKAIGAWFPTEGRAFASGLLASSMAVGAALAPAITAQLLLKISWQTILLIYAIPGMTWALLFFWLIPEPGTSQTKSISKGSLKSDWQAMLGSGSMLLLCLQQFLRAAAMVFFGTWFTRFLEETKGITTLDAGQLTAWAGIGVMLGGISGGTVSDWVLKKTNNKRLSRQGLAVISMTLCSLLFILSHFISDVHLSVFIMALGAYCGAFGGISGYSVAIDFGGSRIATVFSVMNMCGNIGAGLFPLIIGKWIQMGNNWSFALFLFAGIFAIDAVIWALLNPKKPLFDTEEE